jgi:hypothetical protein
MRATAFAGDRIAARFASINDLPIAENERSTIGRWGGAPDDHTSLSALVFERMCAATPRLMSSARWSSGKTASGAISLDLFAVSFMRLCARTFDGLRRHPVDWRTNVNGT